MTNTTDNWTEEQWADADRRWERLCKGWKSEYAERRKAAREEVRAEVRRELIRTFRNWGWTKGASVSYMVGYLSQCGPHLTGKTFHRLNYQNKSTVIRCVLNKLVSKGFAGTVTSIGVNGGECREWELVATPAIQ